MQIKYAMAESVVTVSGTIEFVSDQFGPDEQRRDTPSTATVMLGLRADEGGGSRTLDIDSGKSDNELTVSLTPDGRLTEVAYKATGAGGRIVAAGAKVIAFVGGIAARLAFLSGASPGADEEAEQAWKTANPELSGQRDEYRELTKTLPDKILKARQAAAKAETAAVMQADIARARRLEQLLADARTELDRIETLYRAWRSATITTRRLSVIHTISVDSLPHGAAGTQPDHTKLSDIARQVWDDLGVIVQVEPLYGRVNVGPFHQPEEGSAEDESRLLRWRIPRPVRFTIWRRAANALPSLERSSPEYVVDKVSSTAGVALKSVFFGEETATVSFGEYGFPSKIGMTSTSGWASFMDALGGVPEALSGGLDSADKVQTSISGLVDAAAERDLASKKRELELLQTELENKGLAATAEDVARLKRLEQQVAIAGAEGKLASGAAEADRLEAEFRLVKARTDLDVARRENSLETELGSLRSEVTRLEEALRLEKAKHPQ